ncbi:MAG: hypothetical protein R2818_07000 [Flavobacteriales bacterium]
MNPWIHAPLSLFFAAMLLVTLAACGGGQGHGRSDAEKEGADTAAVAHGAELRFPEPAVSAKELACAEAEFAGKVHYGTPAAHDTIIPTTIQFTVESYRAIAAGLSNCSDTLGMVIHYGFDPDADTLSLAFSFACMTIDKDDMGTINTPDQPLYIIDKAHKLIAVSGSLTAWRTAQGKAFRENIVVDKYDQDKFQNIYKDFDPYMVYKFSRIDSLIKHNSLKPTDRVEVVAIAEPEVWPKTDRGAYFSMHTCLVARTSAGRIIDDTTHVPAAMYAARGADLGSPCPVACGGYVVFLDKGVDVRASCLK